MSDTTGPATTFTAEEMERESAEGFDAFGPEFTRDSDMLRFAAATSRRLASLEGQRCETCKFVGVIGSTGFGDIFPREHVQQRQCRAFGLVPVTANGRPFGCAGWQAKAAQEAR